MIPIIPFEIAFPWLLIILDESFVEFAIRIPNCGFSFHFPLHEFSFVGDVASDKFTKSMEFIVFESSLIHISIAVVDGPFN